MAIVWIKADGTEVVPGVIKMGDGTTLDPEGDGVYVLTLGECGVDSCICDACDISDTCSGCDTDSICTCDGCDSGDACTGCDTDVCTCDGCDSGDACTGCDSGDWCNPGGAQRLPPQNRRYSGCQRTWTNHNPVHKGRDANDKRLEPPHHVHRWCSNAESSTATPVSKDIQPLVHSFTVQLFHERFL